MTLKAEFFLNRILNVSHNEWGRITASWILRFLLQTSTVLGFILMTAFFVEQQGIERLPLLFVLESLFAIGGSFALGNFLKTVSLKKLFVFGTCFSAFFIFLAALSPHTSPLFWGLLLFTYSVCIVQLNIIMVLFIEELFTPLESDHTFPVVESAEPFGTLLAGAAAAGGVLLFNMHAYSFLWMWMGVMLLMLPAMGLLKVQLEPVPMPKSRESVAQRTSPWEQMRNMIEHMTTIPFLKGLFLIVLFHYIAFHLVEFEFTKAIDIDFASRKTHMSEADALTHGLGKFHIFISLIFLFFQLIFASRIIKTIGIVRTMVVHPILSFLGSFFLFLKFSLVSSVGTKTIFEVFGGIQRDAYHASFYALRPKIRNQAKEFLEGIARPLGMLLGTILLIFLQNVFSESFQNAAFSAALMLIFSYMAFESIRLIQKYTFLAKKNLETKGNAPEKIDAIEILAQMGHKNAAQHLIKSLEFRKDQPEVRAKILQTLGALADPLALPEILKFLQDKHREVQFAAVQALSGYKNLGKSHLTKSFSQHRVVEVLKELFVQTKSKETKRTIIEVFRNLNQRDTVPFLLEALETQDIELKADVISICGLFHDVSTVYYLGKFLDDEHPRVRSNAIIALWKFMPYRLKLLMKLNTMFESTDMDSILSAIYAAGELRLIQEVPRLQRFLSHEHLDAQKHASIALLKMGHHIVIEKVVFFLLHQDQELAESTKKLLTKVPQKMQEALQRSLRQKMSKRISAILKKSDTEILEEMEKSVLRDLLEAYQILQAEREILQIEQILEEKETKTSKEKTTSKDVLHHQGSVTLEDLLTPM